MPSQISIHALLAESDIGPLIFKVQLRKFLSTLSLRRATAGLSSCFVRIIFLSTLSLRRATQRNQLQTGRNRQFLSTLSLRRATVSCYLDNIEITISIHALLAESDMAGRITLNGTKISIHALLAESDKTALREFFS